MYYLFHTEYICVHKYIVIQKIINALFRLNFKPNLFKKNNKY